MKSTSDFDEIVVFGSRGHAMMILAEMQTIWKGRVAVRAVVDDIENGYLHPELAVPVVSSEQRLRDFPQIPVMLGIGSPSVRARIARQLVAEDAILTRVVPPPAYLLHSSVTFGPGSFCAHICRVGPNVEIGEGAQVLGMMLAHDVRVGDYSNVNVHASVLGHVDIGREVNIAPHAVIANGTPERRLRIGDGAIIGVGAVVTADVPERARMVGNPAVTVEQWKGLKKLVDRG